MHAVCGTTSRPRSRVHQTSDVHLVCGISFKAKDETLISTCISLVELERVNQRLYSDVKRYLPAIESPTNMVKHAFARK